MLKEFSPHRRALGAQAWGAPCGAKRAASAGGGPEAVRAGDSEGPEFCLEPEFHSVLAAGLCRTLTLWRVTGGKEAKQEPLSPGPGPQLAWA